MVHEAMVLEYSGKSLAMIQWSQSIKQAILLALFVNLFIPVGMASPIGGVYATATSILSFTVKILLLSALVAFLETRAAKWRLFRLPDLLAMAIASSMIGVLFFYL
jgi:formate hydrogenlyase subunit 4